MVSGPIAQEIGYPASRDAWARGSGKRNYRPGGQPGDPERCRAVPGMCDLDCLASQAEFTYCFAEEPSLAQWKMINEEHFDSKTTTVYVLKAEPQHDIIDFLSLNGHDLLDTIHRFLHHLGLQ